MAGVMNAQIYKSFFACFFRDHLALDFCRNCSLSYYQLLTISLPGSQKCNMFEHMNKILLLNHDSKMPLHRQAEVQFRK